MIKVTNTINNTSETFNNINDANEHIATELRWFNACESESSAYDESDFIIEKY